LEQEKIARANLRKDNQASMGTMGEAQRAEFMTAARKLDQGNMDDLTNQEIEMLKSSGRLGEDSTAQLDEEQRQRYRNNVSAEDQDMLNRLDNKEAMDQRTDAEIGNQLQTQQEANDEIIASAEDQGLAGQENNLKIIDATNISVALEDNLDAITYRTVTQVIEALEKRNQILADRITDEVAGEGRKEGDMTNAGNAMALNN
jgi:succinate dehydrogenase flavin-adding protein (antitoxin of CptAB toxin-antitoxin module)